VAERSGDTALATPSDHTIGHVSAVSRGESKAPSTLRSAGAVDNPKSARNIDLSEH